MYYRVLLGATAIAVSILAGLWLGEHWDELTVLWRPETARPTPATSAVDTPENAEEGPAAFEPPLYLYAGQSSGGDKAAAAEETALAAAAGIHRHIVAVPLPWPGQPQDVTPAFERLEALFAADPEAQAVVAVNLNPPASWFEQHASTTVTVDGQALPFPCVASEAWLAEVRAALSTLVPAVQQKYGSGRVIGYHLAALEDGRWSRAGGYDTCQDNVTAFRRWLRLRYANDDALRKAWADDSVTLDTAAVPEAPAEKGGEVFVALPEMQRNVDFLQYSSEAVADAIAAVAAHVKAQAGEDVLVFVPYGYTFELHGNASGHLALARLLDSTVDVLVSPVSYADRGVGGAGGYMGPVDSVLGHGKQWLLLDDTRTGVVADPAAPNATPLAPPSNDILNVQRRNFAAALCRGIGLAWADPDGAGFLNDPDTWDRFGRMREAYRALYADSAVEDRLPPQPLFDRAPLAVVVDEASRFYERDGEVLGKFLAQFQATALRAGLPVQFCLLQDVLRDVVPPSSVYWFVNAFRLTPEQRARLHEILEREKASAVWQYAPGYLADTAAPENIAATVRMGVSAFRNGGRAGSTYALVGKWAAKDEPFGAEGHWRPLFWIDDENANVLARFSDSNKPSVGLVYCEEGWRSVFIAEPTVSPAVLREVLTLLEEHIYFRKTPPVTFDAAYFAPEFIAVHAGEAGDRPIDFGQVYDVGDLFDPETGWPRTRLINLALYPGETRILHLQPSYPGP